jgi:hypothetical protein
MPLILRLHIETFYTLNPHWIFTAKSQAEYRNSRKRQILSDSGLKARVVKIASTSIFYTTVHQTQISPRFNI